MTARRSEAEWTPDVVRRFWSRFAPRVENQDLYFSRQVGAALTRILSLAGALEGNLLDFGCGPGYLLRRICEQPRVSAYGVDYSAASIEQARLRLGSFANFKGASVIDSFPVSLPAGHFDTVTCIETIEHVLSDELQPLLHEILRLLKPAGVALFTTPCNEDLDSGQAYCPFCDSEFHQMQHLRAFSPAQLRETLQRAGFEVVFCEGLNLWRFQNTRQPSLIDYSARDVARVAYSWTRGAVGDLAERVAQKPFPHNSAFRARLSAGNNLVAVVRKPGPS